MQKKTDYTSLIGVVLMSFVMMWFLNKNMPTEEELAKENETTETTVKQKEEQKEVKNLANQFVQKSDSKEETISLENELVKITFSSKGAQVSKALLKKHKTYKGEPLYLVNEGNSDFNLSFKTKDNLQVNTNDLNFQSSLSKSEKGQQITFVANISEGKSIQYTYTLPNDDYMMDFTINSKGLSDVINSKEIAFINWKTKTIRKEKGDYLEDMNNELYFSYDDDRIDYELSTGDKPHSEEKLNWIAFRQHLFTSILLFDEPVKNGILSVDKSKDEKNFVKEFESILPLEIANGDINYSMNYYFGPVQYETLDKYDRNLNRLVQFGWGIFRWVNMYFIYPIFKFMKSIGLHLGLIIFLLTIAIKIVLSPVTYKQYLQSAKMKIIRPEIDALNEKFKDSKDPMKKQQATMELHRKAGVNPMAGCLPALLQMPILLAMYRFFPALIDLRGKSFLWAEDLSTFDSIYELPFHIPLYGSHISLFTVLMAISMFFYTKINGSTNMQQSSIEGMPDMKMLMYLSPLMMLFFFNRYASGLTYYYLVANVTTILLTLFIKNFVLSEDKIHAKIKAAKAKPKKRNKMQQKLDEMMRQAQEQQQNKK